MDTPMPEYGKILAFGVDQSRSLLHFYAFWNNSSESGALGKRYLTSMRIT
jgi:hypothetical protein